MKSDVENEYKRKNKIIIDRSKEAIEKSKAKINFLKMKEKEVSIKLVQLENKANIEIEN
jgi:hypothetical protein